MATTSANNPILRWDDLDDIRSGHAVIGVTEFVGSPRSVQRIAEMFDERGIELREMDIGGVCLVESLWVPDDCLVVKQSGEVVRVIKLVDEETT